MINVDYSKRVYGLDVFRAIAILLVVRAHSGIFTDKLFKGFPSIPTPDGVELFFVLSGYLIGGILIRIIQKENGLTLSSLLNFWKRRWFRTLPNYYLILLLNILWVYLGWNDNRMEALDWKFFFFVQNFSGPFYGFFWESWSLSIEEWFYVISPILIAVLYRVLGLKKAVILSSLVLIAFSIIYRIYGVEAPSDGFWWDVSYRKLVLTRLDAIMFGVIGAYVSHFHPQAWTKLKWPGLALGIALFFFNLYIDLGWDTFYGQVIKLSVISIYCAALLPLASSIRSFRLPWLGTSLTFISLISYSMYLINLGLVSQVIKTHFMPQTRMEEALAYSIYWLIVIGGSTLLYRFWEKPMMDLRDR